MRAGTLSDRAETYAAYARYLSTLGSDNSAFRQAFREAFFCAMREQLTEPQYRVLWMIEVEGLSGKETAAQMGISPSAVSRHRTRGKRRLRTLLAYNLELRHQPFPKDP